MAQGCHVANNLLDMDAFGVVLFGLQVQREEQQAHGARMDGIPR